MKNRKQINYINNRHNLINIEKLNTEENFWFGLVAGIGIGIFAASYLVKDRLEKKETKD